MNPQAKIEANIQTLMDAIDHFPYDPDHGRRVEQIKSINAEHSDLVREIYGTRNGHQGSAANRPGAAPCSGPEGGRR